MIRKANASDIPTVIALGTQAVIESDTPQNLPDATRARLTLQQMLRDPSFLVLVAEAKDAGVVGFVIGSVDQHWYRRDWFVTDMGFFVKEGHRVLALGLLRRLIRWAKAMPKVTEVLLAVSTGQKVDERAGEFFGRNGFKRQGGLYRLAVGRLA